MAKNLIQIKEQQRCHSQLQYSLFLFFPLTILGYYLIHPKLQNIFLLIASLAFYAWGEPKFIIIFLAAIFFNYLAGLVLGELRRLKNSKLMVMIVAVAVNISLLFYYKYLLFGAEIINSVFNTGITIREIALPLGISFFTFRSISYILDVYWEKSEAQKNPNKCCFVHIFLSSGFDGAYYTIKSIFRSTE